MINGGDGPRDLSLLRVLRCGAVEATGDPVEEYLAALRAGLRTPPGRTDEIVAEAEDHLRESAAAGQAAPGDRLAVRAPRHVAVAASDDAVHQHAPALEQGSVLRRGRTHRPG